MFILYTVSKSELHFFMPGVCDDKPNVQNFTYTGKCPKPEQFLKAEHLLKHAFPYRDRSFYGPDGYRQIIYQ